jgi:hypothetical protein
MSAILLDVFDDHPVAEREGYSAVSMHRERRFAWWRNKCRSLRVLRGTSVISGATRHRGEFPMRNMVGLLVCAMVVSYFSAQK